MELQKLNLLGITVLPVLGILLLLVWKKATKLQAVVVGIISESLSLISALLLIPALNAGETVTFSVPWIRNMGIHYSLELTWLSFIFLLTEILVTLAGMFFSLGETTGEKNSHFYYALLLLFSLGMSGTTLAEDVFLFYVFWELMLIASVILILIWGKGAERNRIALKYFIITHIGSLMVLVSLITLYVNLGTASLNVIAQSAGNLALPLVNFLIAFFVIGFCVKMAIFPLHIWLPDAHTVAPMPVTIVLAAAMLSMGTYGILRFPMAIFTLERMQPFALWLMIAGLISEVYGALMAFAEKKIKRIIAYSSVSQMGYILYGLGTLTEAGMIGGIMHVVYHAIVKALLFMVVGVLLNVTHEETIEKVGGLGRKLPVLVICAAIGVLGISGMPPLGIFNSEWMIFTGGFNTDFPVVLTVLTLLGSLFTVIYSLRFFGAIFFGKLQPENIQQPSRLLLIPTIVVTVFLIVEGLIPGPLYTWASRSLAVVLGGIP
ncbi:MAG: NADH-quinone oxidoreductase subunit M [Anaerolineae bacterium]|jgi:NADH-quinone oxidoreductase subunit M|nr:NADH-quinone oxidoreductase subunit M [Anaerolineae bacterium]